MRLSFTARMPFITRVPFLARLRYSLLLLAAFAAAVPATGQPDAEPMETSRRFGNHTVHYVVFPSTFLQEEVASQLQIVRAPNRSVINIAVRRDTADGGDSAKTALVSGTFSDLIQPKQLEFREIREQDAIYYIADFRHGNNETLRFKVEVQPDPNAPAHSLIFTRKLDTEP